MKRLIVAGLVLAGSSSYAYAQSALEAVAYIVNGIEDGSRSPYGPPFWLVKNDPLQFISRDALSTYTVTAKNPCTYLARMEIESTGYHFISEFTWDFTNAIDLKYVRVPLSDQYNVIVSGAKMTCHSTLNNKTMDCQNSTTFDAAGEARAKKALAYLKEKFCKGTGKAF